MHTHRNPADLLGLDRDPRLHRLLRACGADESCITGCASDYDKFFSLAAALPLCEGHPLRDEVNGMLASATGLSVPLCPHTAHAYWVAWTEKHLYGSYETNDPRPLCDCPYCDGAEPIFLCYKDVAHLPDPTTVREENLQAWSAALEETFVSVTGKIPLYHLPADYVFTRPNPYHANRAVGKVCAGEALTSQEQDLLLTQALRVWGQAALKHPSKSMMLLRGGCPEAIMALLAYLDSSKTLSTMTWIPDRPADAGSISGLYACVGTGFVCRHASDAVSYAAVAPVGRAIVWAE